MAIDDCGEETARPATRRLIRVVLRITRAHSPVVAAEIASPAPRNHIAVQQKKPPQLRETFPAPTARVRALQVADDIPA